MKLMIVSVISWWFGLGAYLLSLYALDGETMGGADLTSLLYWSVIASVLAFSLIYAPIMFLLRRLLRGCQPAFAFPLVASLIFIVPVMFILIAFGGGAHPENSF